MPKLPGIPHLQAVKALEKCGFREAEGLWEQASYRLSAMPEFRALICSIRR